jgi:hypothetical protein
MVPASISGKSSGVSAGASSSIATSVVGTRAAASPKPPRPETDTESKTAGGESNVTESAEVARKVC